MQQRQRPRILRNHKLQKMKFELTILGSGSSIPTADRNSAAQVLNVLGRHFLIDCAEATQHRLRLFHVPYNRINHIFISHLHGDHFYGLMGFLSTLSLQGRRGEMHIYADSRLQELIGMQLKIMRGHFLFPIVFHALGREEEVIYEDKVVRVSSFPLKHRCEAPVCGFLFREKERERTILKDMVEVWKIPVAFMQHLKKGADYVTPSGEIVANCRLTAPPPLPRSYAYMTDTLFREEFAGFVQGVSLLYHEATYGREEEALARECYHSTAEQAARLAKAAGAGKLLLGHFSARYRNPGCLLPEARAVFPESYICSDGDVYGIPAQKRQERACGCTGCF